MAVNILSKRVADMSDVPVKNADGSPMVDDQGKPVTATMFSPGTKIYEVAKAAQKRKAVRRTRENGGKIEAAFDNENDDTVEFLCAIIKRFNNLEIECDDQSDKGVVLAVLSDPLLGFVRDHLDDAASNWENFTKASQPVSVSTSDNSHG